MALLDLTVSNPTEVINYPHEAIRQAYGRITDFTYHPNPLGDEAARTAIAKWYAAQGITISPNRLVLTASSSEAYALLLKLFCDHNDEILVPTPSYPLFEFLAGFESVRLLTYRLLYDGAWFIDFSSLRQKISEHTRAIIIVNPNNPTGSFVKESEKNELIRLSEEHQLPLISDEVFMGYGGVSTLIGCDSVLTFSLNGLSKIAGMPQMKLGWIAVNGPPAIAQVALDRLEILFDTYLSVAAPVQRALPDLVTLGGEIQRQIAQLIKSNLHLLDRMLENTAAYRLHFEGGWSAIIRLPGTLPEDVWVARLLEEQNVLVQPGYFFDMESEPYIVVSLITPPAILQEGLQRLSRLLT